MIDISVDVGSLTRQLTSIEQKQIPFAAMKSVNELATTFQDVERKDVLAKKFTLRRPEFIKRTIKIERGNFATRDNLRAIVGVDPTRDLLSKFEKDGEKKPREGRSIAIPVGARRNKADIVPQSQRPRALGLTDVSSKGGVRVAKGDRRAFLIARADGTGGIFQRVGRGKNSTIKELFAFKPKVPIKNRLDFAVTARRVAAERWPKIFSKWLDIALKSAK